MKSTQETRIALGYASSNSYASFVVSKLSAFFRSRRTNADKRTHYWQAALGYYDLNTTRLAYNMVLSTVLIIWIGHRSFLEGWSFDPFPCSFALTNSERWKRWFLIRNSFVRKKIWPTRLALSTQLTITSYHVITPHRHIVNFTLRFHQKLTPHQSWLMLGYWRVLTWTLSLYIGLIVTRIYKFFKNYSEVKIEGSNQRWHVIMCNVVPANGGVLSMEYELTSFILSQT